MHFQKFILMFLHITFYFQIGSFKTNDNEKSPADAAPIFWRATRCTGSPTLRPRTCERPVVSQPLGDPKQYRALNLRSSWPCRNTRLNSPKNTTTYQWGIHNSQWIMNSFAKWSWTWHHIVVIHVRLLFFGRITTSLLLLLLLLLHYVNL